MGTARTVPQLPAHPVMNLREDTFTHLNLGLKLGLLRTEPTHLLQVFGGIPQQAFLLSCQGERGTHIGAQHVNDGLRFAAALGFRQVHRLQPLIGQLNKRQYGAHAGNGLNIPKLACRRCVPIVPQRILKKTRVAKRRAGCIHGLLLRKKMRGWV